MSSTVQRKKHIRDRYDGWYLSDLDAMHVLMPYLFGARTSNEAVMSEIVDLTEVDKFLAKKNADNPDFKYTWFHFIVAAIAKAIMLRPKMNYFISGNRYYERKKIQVAFVVKRQFNDQSDEANAKFTLDRDGGSVIDQVHEYVRSFVHDVRVEEKKVTTDGPLGVLKHLPRPLLRLFAWTMNRLEYHGLYPKDFASADPSYSSAFVSNLGSIKMNADYHHLFNWGNNSFFVVISEKKFRPFFKEDGSYDMRNTIKLGMTIDERIADGYYYAKTLQLVRHIFAHPELLDEPAAAPITVE